MTDLFGDSASPALALARKWRPRAFADLKGQEHVVQALSNALTQGRLHHAYLLTGTRGVGKTTLARILAKCLNCETGVTATPCGTCSACTPDRRRALRRPARTRCGVEHRRRQHARGARQRAVRADGGALQGLHHRRSAHAVEAGVQLHAEDAGRAARACEVHPRHHRPAEDSGDGALALPAVQPEADAARAGGAASGRGAGAGKRCL